MLLRDLTVDQLEQLLLLARLHKHRFAATAKEVFATAEKNDIAEEIARIAINGECLLLAAYMHRGHDDSSLQGFLVAASAAYECATADKRKSVGLS